MRKTEEKKNSEDRRQKTEDRRQKTEDRRKYRNLTTDFTDYTDLREENTEKEIEQKITKKAKKKTEESPDPRLRGDMFYIGG